MDSRFVLIIANFRSDRLNDVEKRLEKLDVERLNVCKVKGFGEYHNYFAPNWLEYEVRVEIFTKRAEVDAIARAIMDAAHSGCAGEGNQEQLVWQFSIGLCSTRQSSRG